MTNLSKEEKIAKLGFLIEEGKKMFVTKYFEQPDYSFDGEGAIVQSYSDVNHDAYPGWRGKSLLFLRSLLGENHPEVKGFEENCKANSSESYLRQGIGVLEAVKSGYQDDLIGDDTKLKENLQSGYPKKYWHCAIKPLNLNDYSVVNDLSFEELQKKIIEPWMKLKPFTVDGKIVNKREDLEEIKITQTPETQDYYKKIHDAKMEQANIIDAATNRKMLPLDEGNDYTQELLFENILTQNRKLENPSLAIIERACERIGKTVTFLSNRTRKGKTNFIVEDEYDIQDILQATLKAFIKHSVQENPLPKVGGSSSRADITIQELGLLIEIKYVRGPDDQKKLVEAFAEDILFYSQWEHLKQFFYLIYNSADLRDPEELETLNGSKEMNSRRFNSKVILV